MSDMFYFFENGSPKTARGVLEVRVVSQWHILYGSCKGRACICILFRGPYLNSSWLSKARKECYHCLAVPNSSQKVPSRRTAKKALRAKVFSYYTIEERQLIERAAKLESRSLSSFVALAAIEKAHRVIGRK